MLDMSKFSIGQILFIIHTILNSQLSQSELPCQLIDKIYSSINARASFGTVANDNEKMIVESSATMHE